MQAQAECATAIWQEPDQDIWEARGKPQHYVSSKLMCWVALDGFVLRYRTEETDDGLSGKEGTFVICSFWLVSALAIIGEMERSRTLMDRLVRAASPLGLYAEEFDAETGRHLGNFPQAFSHLALVEAAARMIVAESLAEVDGP